MVRTASSLWPILRGQFLLRRRMTDGGRNKFVIASIPERRVIWAER